MQFRKLGSSGIETSVIGLGTWAMGGWMWGGTDDKASIAAIHGALDTGVNLIDTAPAYGLGKAEELVGQAIKGRRDQVVLATKCGLVWGGNQGNYFFDEEGQQVRRYLGGQSIRTELQSSLQRLGTDYIDLYITHWQDPTTPIAETMDTLLALKKEGKIRAIGVSNVSAAELKEYLACGPIDAIQEKYNMLDRDIEGQLLPICGDFSTSVLSYSSLAQGILSGKIGPDRQFSGDDQRINDPRFSLANRIKIKSLLDKIAPLAEDYQLSIAQLVIAWTVAQSPLMFALCGARNLQQAEENAAAGDVQLSSGDVQQITAAVDRYLQQAN